MSRYKVTYTSGESEEFEANGFVDAGDGRWLDFLIDVEARGTQRQVARIQQSHISRVDRVGE